MPVHLLSLSVISPFFPAFHLVLIMPEGKWQYSGLPRPVLCGRRGSVLPRDWSDSRSRSARWASRSPAKPRSLLPLHQSFAATPHPAKFTLNKGAEKGAIPKIFFLIEHRPHPCFRGCQIKRRARAVPPCSPRAAALPDG